MSYIIYISLQYDDIIMFFSPMGKNWSSAPLACKRDSSFGGNDKTRGPWATSLTWKINKIHKSIKTFDDIITLIKRRRKNHYYLCENLLVLHLKKLESPSPKDALCQYCLKLDQWFRGFFYFVNVFLLFLNYVSMEKGRTLHLNKLKSPSAKDTLCQVWLKLA